MSGHNLPEDMRQAQIVYDAVDDGNALTFSGAHTFSGANTHSGATTFSGATTRTSMISSTITMGTSTSTRAFTGTTTSSSVATGTSIRPIYNSHTATGAGSVGHRVEFAMTTNVALGGWSNALKGIVTYGTSGRTNGLGSAVCGELILSAGTTQGNYAPLETELVANSAVSTGTATGFIYGNIAGTNGTGKTTLNTNAYFAILGAGVVDTTDGMFDLETITAAQVFHAALRIKVGATDYFIGLCNDKSFT